MKTMKSGYPIVLTLLIAAASAHGVAAQVGSNGYDGNLDLGADVSVCRGGALENGTDCVIELGLAPSGAWDTDRSADPGNFPAGRGIYDASQWAVVFHYQNVNIPNGVVVKFRDPMMATVNHPNNPPVIWLASGNVTIDGEVNLNGGDGMALPDVRAVPGPGGFRGGEPRFDSLILGSAGFGPGASPYNNFAGTATYAVDGSRPAYGNNRILPLIGGSGGGGHSNANQAGGAGGGAILIAGDAQVVLGTDGLITAIGGARTNATVDHGSGGAVRILGDTVSIVGTVDVRRGLDDAGRGRIRVEGGSSVQVTGVLEGESTTYVHSQAVQPDPVWPRIFPDQTLSGPFQDPTLRIVRIGDADAENVDPRGEFSFGEVDLRITPVAPGTPTRVHLCSRNVPDDGTWTVQLLVTPTDGKNYNDPALGTLTTTTPNTTDPNPCAPASADLAAEVYWTIDLNVTDGFSSVQARAFAN